jgi:hypothetical protein
MPRLSWISIALLAGLLCSGCETQVRVYDPYRRDYHHWDAHERVYYEQWARETHHEDRDYNRLNAEEQRQYWEWRHQHGG